MSLEEIHPQLRGLVDEWASEAPGMDAEGVVTQLREMYDLDLAEMSDENAEMLVEAYDDDDLDKMKRALKSAGLSAAKIQQLESVVAQSVSEGSSEGNGHGDETDTGQSRTSTNGQSPDQSQGLTDAQRAEIQEMVPTADQIASQIENRAAQPQPQQQGDGKQSEAALQLAQAFLKSQNGGGANAQVGEMFQKAALKSYLRRLSRPSFGELMEKRMYEKMADEHADEWAEEMFKGDPMDEIEELSEDDEEGDGGILGMF